MSEPPVAMRGKQWLDQALATAASTSCQLVVLNELANAHAAAGQPATALALLEDAGRKFTDVRDLAAVAALRRGIEQGQSEDKREKLYAELRAMESYRDELRRRLAEAKSNGDAEAVRRYEKLLGAQE